MYCMKCSHHVAHCTCPDIDARLASLSHPNVALTFCSGCGEYHARCQCPEPKPLREMRSEGRILKVKITGDDHA